MYMPQSPDIRAELAHAALGEHYQDKIRYGDPSIGWDGDPWLTLAYNKLENRYEIWVEDPGRDPVCVMQTKPFHELDGAPSITELCIKLRDHDLRKISVDVILKRIDEHNAAREAEVAAHHEQTQMAAMEKVYWDVGKQTDNYKPVIGGFG